MKKKWSVKVNFRDGSFFKSVSKLNYREEGVLEVIYKIEKKFPKKNIISDQII